MRGISIVGSFKDKVCFLFTNRIKIQKHCFNLQNKIYLRNTGGG